MSLAEKVSLGLWAWIRYLKSEGRDTMGKAPESSVPCLPPLPLGGTQSKPGCGTNQEKGKLGLTPCVGSHAGSTNCLETFKKKISVKSNCSFSLMPSAVPFCLYLFQIFFQVFAKRCVDWEQPPPGRVFSRSWPCGGISHWGVLREILLAA